MKKFLKKFFSKPESKVESVPIEPVPEQVEVRSNAEQIALSQIGEWLKAQEAQFLDTGNVEEEINDYLHNLREVAQRINNQIDQYIDSMDLTQLRYTTVGEINLLVSDAQTLVKLVHTKQTITAENVDRFSSAVQERARKLMEKMGSQGIGEELISLWGLNPEVEDPAQNNPLWLELNKISLLKDEFEHKRDSGKWQKWSLLQRLLNLMITSEEKVQILKFRMKANQQHLLQAQESWEERQREFSVLRNEEGFEELEDREENKEMLSPQMEQAKQKVLVFFSPLKPYLHQLQEFDPDSSILDDYLTSYLTAFYEDDDLNIIPLIRKLRLYMEDQRVKVDQADLALIMERVEQANSGKLRELQKEYTQVKSKYQEAEKTVNRALSMKYEDLKYRVEHFEAEVKKLKKQVKEIEEQIKLEEISQKKAKDKFESLVRENLGKDVEVVV